MKEKLIVLLIALVVLLVVCDMEAEASAIDYTPSYWTDSLKTSSPSANNKVYHFYLGTDEVLCDETGTVYSLVGDSVVLDFEFSTISAQFPTGSYYNSYDYFNLVLTPHGTSNWTSTQFDELGTLLNQEAVCRHYAVVNGEKYYMADDKTVTIPVTNVTDDITVSFGIEVSTVIDYTGFASSDSAFTSYFGWLTFSATELSYDTELVGVRYASTGDEAIKDSIISWGNIQNNSLNNIRNAITVTLINKLTSLGTQLTENLNTNFANTLSKLDAFMDMAQDNHDAMDALINEFYADTMMWLGDTWSEIMWGFEDMRTWMKSHSQWLSSTYTEFKNDFQLKHETIVSKLDEIIETLTRGYDNSGADNLDRDVDNDLLELDTAQKEVISGGVDNLDNFTVPSDGFDSFDPSFVGAFALVSGMLQSIFASSGNFSVIMSVIFILTVTTMLLGLFRYYKR